MAHTHSLLLSLAGRVDDDLLATARELVAVGEEPQALEILVATLIADRTPLPADVRAQVVELAAGLDVDATELAPEGEGRVHVFGPGPQTRLPELVAAAAPAGSTALVTWRNTPAGGAPGPVPHPVVLVELGEGSYAPEVVSYRLGAHLARAGFPASVEAYTPADELPAYQRAALAATGVQRPSPVPRDSGPAPVEQPPTAPPTAPTIAPTSTPPTAPAEALVDAPPTGPVVAAAPAQSVAAQSVVTPGAPAPGEAPGAHRGRPHEPDSPSFGGLLTHPPTFSTTPAGPPAAGGENGLVPLVGVPGNAGGPEFGGPDAAGPGGAALPPRPGFPQPDGLAGSGVDRRGVNQHGVNQHGVDQHGLDQHGVDQHGVDQQGVDQHAAAPDHRAPAPGGHLGGSPAPGGPVAGPPAPGAHAAGPQASGAEAQAPVPLVDGERGPRPPVAPGESVESRPLRPVPRPSPVARTESRLPETGAASPGPAEPPTAPYGTERSRRSGPSLSVVPPVPGQEVSRGPRPAPVTRPTPVVPSDAEPTPMRPWPVTASPEDRDPPLLASMHDPLSGPLREPLLDAQLDRADTGPLETPQPGPDLGAPSDLSRFAAPSPPAEPGPASVDVDPAAAETPGEQPTVRDPERSWTQDWASGAWAMPTRRATPEDGAASPAGSREVTGPVRPDSEPAPADDEISDHEISGYETDEPARDEPPADVSPGADHSTEAPEPGGLQPARREPADAHHTADLDLEDRDPAETEAGGEGTALVATDPTAGPDERPADAERDPADTEVAENSGTPETAEHPEHAADTGTADTDDDPSVAADDAPTGRRAAVDGRPTIQALPGGRRRARHRPEDADPWGFAGEVAVGDDGLPPPRPVPRTIPRVRRAAGSDGPGGLFGPGEVPPARADGPFGTGPRPGNPDEGRPDRSGNGHAPTPENGADGGETGMSRAFDSPSPDSLASLSSREQELLRRLHQELAVREEQPERRRNGSEN
ncbi:hypothetical protein [Pseudonocardia sp. WMMC193]|uniref:hypothetical protein n=1 Tax=Pseudonocardia sp. WMMC193 TaxID=2911965 RepID=UPI001F1CA3AF|nr:hypothetical protein [Pseudonocardia sp. WMMC193]MCF7552146.1 hypothetical protein [Pseudonocardia sp. WMMC193]